MNPPFAPLVLAIDPGRDKCGVVLVEWRDDKETVHLRRIVPGKGMMIIVKEIGRNWPLTHVVLGDSTASAQWRAKIEEWLPQVEIFLVNERNSSYEARALYWETYPPRGWRRLLPLSLQEPPEPIDDFAAVVLARRFWKNFEGVAIKDT